MTYHDCFECIGYMERRKPVLLPAMAEHTQRTGESASSTLDRYMRGVHRRHLSGLSLAVTA